MLKDQKGISADEYRDDIVFSRIALKKLAGDSEEEQRRVFERLRLFSNIQVFLGEKSGGSSGPAVERRADRDRRLDELERKVDQILETLRGGGATREK